MTMPEAQKSDHGAEPFAVYYRGNSMRGAFKPMERLRVQPVPLASLFPGDVIVFLQPNDATKRVVHRIVKKSAQGFRTRGDNMPRRDPYTVAPGQIEGKVVAVWRAGRWQPVPGGGRGLMGALPRRAVASFRALTRLSRVRGWLRRWNAHAARNWPGVALSLESVTKRGKEGEQQVLRWQGRRIATRCLPGGDWRVRFPFGFLLSPDLFRLPEEGGA